MSSGVRLLFDTRGKQTAVALDEFVDAQMRETVARDANRWIKGLRHARVDGVPLRERFLHRGDSLWWFTELYLHKDARIASWLRIMHSLECAIDRLSPDGIIVETANDEAQTVIESVARKRHVRLDRSAKPSGLSRWRGRWELEGRSRFYTWTAHLSRARSRPLPPARRHGIAAFVHSAFWRPAPRKGPSNPHGPATGTEGEESYIGPVLDAIRAATPPHTLQLVGVGPRTNFRARTWWHGATVAARDAALPLTPVEAFATTAAIAPAVDIWRSRHANLSHLLRSPDLREAARVAGHDLWPLVADQLRAVVLLQWPWSARAMDEAGAALDALEPDVAVTYAEAGGWGRAIVLEARRRGIATVGLQHGFIYRHWLNYLHEPDEMAASALVKDDIGFPRPTRTLLFDRYAEAHLRECGHFPAEALAVTGSARLDALAVAVRGLSPEARDRALKEVGARPGDAIILLVSKYSQIERAFRTVAEAVSARPGWRLVVKCHPAETSEPYVRAAAGLDRIHVMGAAADLAALLATARAVVTVNSTVAIDALVLGVPSLVVDLPNNLSPFVEAGAMHGADGAADIATGLAELVGETELRARVLARGSQFVSAHQIRSDGQSAARARDEILALAQPGPGRENASLRKQSGGGSAVRDGQALQ